MITFVLYGISTITGTAVPGTVYWLTSLIDGLVFLPLLTLVMVPYLGRITREKMGRLHYMQAAFPMHAIACVLTPWGYEFAPVKDGFAKLADGTNIEIGSEDSWYRLGNRQFAVTYLPDERVLGDFAADPDEMSFKTVEVEDGDGNKQPVLAVFERGGVLDKVRGSFHGWTPFTNPAEVSGYIVSLSRAINSLRGGGGVRLSERTERMARVEHGGKANLTGTSLIYAYLGVIFVGALFTTVAMLFMG